MLLPPPLHSSSEELRLTNALHAELLALMHFLHPERFELAGDFDLNGKFPCKQTSRIWADHVP